MQKKSRQTTSSMEGTRTSLLLDQMRQTWSPNNLSRSPPVKVSLHQCASAAEASVAEEVMPVVLGQEKAADISLARRTLSILLIDSSSLFYNDFMIVDRWRGRFGFVTSWWKVVGGRQGILLTGPKALSRGRESTVQLDLSAFECTFMYLAEIPIPILFSSKKKKKKKKKKKS